MRVIGGTARGRPIRAPRSKDVRPTSDRVREAMFDVLAQFGVPDDASVLDLFAGSGALGLEAASRGAQSVTFVEQDRRVAVAIEDNLARTGLGAVANTKVVISEALSFCRLRSDRFELALIDPPYRYSDWAELLSLVKADLVVCESDREIELPREFRLHRVYRYGTTLLTVGISPTREDVKVDQ